MGWTKLTRSQQNHARQLRDRSIAAGIAESVSQIAKDLPGWEARIVAAERAAERAASHPTEDELLAERERLLGRIAEIDRLLPEPPAVEATTRQAAEALGVSIRTVQRWAASGKVQATKDAQGHWIITITIKRG